MIRFFVAMLATLTLTAQGMELNLRTQQVDIYFNYIGQFHIPDEPLSPEERAAGQSLTARRGDRRAIHEDLRRVPRGDA